MAGRILLRKAAERDLPLIVRFLKDSNLPFEDIPSKIDSIFVASIDAMNMGIGGVEIYGDYAMLRSIVIENSFRGKGYGKALCRKLIRHARSKGVKELYLLTNTAENFFSELGFQKVAREDAPKAVQETTEFRELCSQSSVCMRKRIDLIEK